MQYKGKEIVESALFSVPVNVRSYNFSLGGVEEKAMCLRTAIVDDSGMYGFDAENSKNCYIKIDNSTYFQETEEYIPNPRCQILNIRERRAHPEIQSTLTTKILCGRLSPRFADNGCLKDLAANTPTKLYYTNYPQGAPVDIVVEDDSICDIVSNASTAEEGCVLVTGKKAGTTYATVTFHSYKGYEGLTREIAVQVS